MAFPWPSRRMVSCATAAVLVISGTCVALTLYAPDALASGTQLFSQPFNDNTVNGPAGSVSLPAAEAGTNGACLTAAGNSTANPLASCPTATDTQGSGTLRLTSAADSAVGAVFASTSVPTSQGVDVNFDSYQYGGTVGADGIAFVLAAANPADPQTPATAGPSGGSLGYSAQVGSSLNGLVDGYMGIGLDAYGNFSNSLYEGSGCSNPAYIHTSGSVPGQVVVRGPGNGTVGYCALASTATTTASPALALRATTRAASLVPVEVVFNPTSSSVTTASGLVVPGGDYDVTFTPAGGTARSLAGALPVVPSGLYPASWVNANGIPRQLTLGWVASTGAKTDFHEISNATVSSLNPVPFLAASQTSYTGSSLVAGTPVTYQVAASSSGAAEDSPVTVTETMPSGVVPVGASGPGWVCGAPSGQQISCTDSTSPFTGGTITVNGVVTSGSMTTAIIESSTTAVASSNDADPGTSSSAVAGTVPAAPDVTGVSPSSGPAGGSNDVTVSGTNLGGATAIEVGTATQFAAGTPTTLNLCASSAAGCFTVTSATSLDISSMPAHAAGAVTVKVVSLGLPGTGAYTYTAGPALLFPAPPGGEAEVAYSDQLTVTGGTSPYAWSVSTGNLPAGITLSSSTGLLSGTPTTAGSYSFTVKVTDSASLTATEPVILTVIAGPSLSFPVPPAALISTAYNYALTESGGTSPYAWSVSSGTLPAGISLSADGTLTGTPTANGTSSFTVNVTDADSQSATEATSLTVSDGVHTTFAAPAGGEVQTAYTDTLTAAAGTAPYTWSVNSGSLPPGITLSSAGVLAGTPTTAGSYPFTVKVTDHDGGTATTPVTLVITPSVALSVSATSADFGKTVTLTATMAPAAAAGAVTFTDTLSTGPLSGQTVTLGTVTLSGGTATLTTAPPALNTNTITAVYSGDLAYAAAASAPTGIQVTAYAGEVIINQFRLSGPGGAADQYTELYNAGPALSLAGFTLAASSGASVTVPASAPVLPSGGSYLITGAGYSLGTTVAASDLQTASLGTAGLRVIAPDGPGTVTDAAGSAGALTGFYSGTPLPALTGTPTDQYAWVRLEKDGVPANTGSNAADFQLVSTTGAVVGGVQSCLGSPSPQATGSPAQADADFQSALLDPSRSILAAPNFVYVRGTPGLLTIRRTITNTSGAVMTDGEIRITSLSEVNGPPEPGVTTQPPTPAQLRFINPATPTTQITITGGQTVTVLNLSLGAPATAVPGGGLDSTLTASLPGGTLAPGASVSISLSFAVDRHGPYWYGYDFDAIAITAPASAPARQSRAGQRAAPPSQLLHLGPPSRGAAGHGTLP